MAYNATVPKPIPPPPPQPSAEETVLAVRYVRVMSFCALAIFLLLASRYQHDALMTDYGRDDGPSWALWRARGLDEAALRAHAGEKLVWMLGSSVMRESFDEAFINQQLTERKSPWRVVKIGMPRGAAGMAVGLMDELPIRAGDRVIHSVAIDNFHRDWIEMVGLPIRMVSQMRSPAEIWGVEEFPLQERLEIISGVPYNFYRHHESYMQGQLRWFKALVWHQKIPRKRSPKYHLTHRKLMLADYFGYNRSRGSDSRLYVAEDELDMSPSQFNMAGLAQLRADVAAKGAELRLLDVPYRQEYQLNLMDEGVRAIWQQWRAEQPELSYFPQLPEDHYYDLRHPNPRGRAALSRYLLDWMAETPRGRPTPLFWTPEKP